jgi:hypothetical protein
MTGLLSNKGRSTRLVGVGTLLIIAMFAATTFSATGSSAPTTSPNLQSDTHSSLLAQGVSATPIAAATPVAPSACDAIAPGVGSEPWVRVELYFGTSQPDGEAVTDEEWQAFLDEEITPRFPDGLTVLDGYGQFLNSSDVIIAEESIVLIIFVPLEFAASSSDLIEEVRDTYETQFEQESVLRADSEPVCISF